MSRVLALLVVAASLAVAFLIPASASGDVNGCPPGFTLFRTIDIGSLNDHNGDELICVKLVAPHGGMTQEGLILIDNNIPDRTARGRTNDGSDVLVDTGSGDVLGG